MNLSVGFGGVARNACVTLCAGDKILGTCEQERITRVRGAGFNVGGLPDEALDELLRRASRQRHDVSTFAVAEPMGSVAGIHVERLEHHFTHACASFLPSPFDSATIIICDHDGRQISVWDGDGNSIREVPYRWEGLGFAELFGRFAEAIGFSGPGHEQRMESLARLTPPGSDSPANQIVGLAGNRLSLADDWRAQLFNWVDRENLDKMSRVASALQARLGDLVLEFIADVRRQVPLRRYLCLGGSLFNNSHFNTQVKLRAGFDATFIPINPGNAGLATGAALHLNRNCRVPVTPFLGPSYGAEELKATLDNCKLTYKWVSDEDAVTIAVDALKKGFLVGWFDGSMEWGARSLGARSIVANPFAPYALDNLNRFLKHRDVWRGYALSGLKSAVSEHFDGPEESPFMECDYIPKDPERFKNVLPARNAAVRLHTVGPESPRRFVRLLEAFGETTGIPVLVNTSFNGFREPIVCSPRDAIRVFFGTGVDLLVLGQFVISK